MNDDAPAGSLARVRSSAFMTGADTCVTERIFFFTLHCARSRARARSLATARERNRTPRQRIIVSSDRVTFQ